MDLEGILNAEYPGEGEEIEEESVMGEGHIADVPSKSVDGERGKQFERKSLYVLLVEYSRSCPRLLYSLLVTHSLFIKFFPRNFCLSLLHSPSSLSSLSLSFSVFLSLSPPSLSVSLSLPQLPLLLINQYVAPWQEK